MFPVELRARVFPLAVVLCQGHLRTVLWTILRALELILRVAAPGATSSVLLPY